jgi:YD repeat-containing protein
LSAILAVRADTESDNDNEPQLSREGSEAIEIKMHNVTQTTLTDPNGNIRQINFGTPPTFADGYYQSGGFATTDTRALGKPEQEVTTYQNDPSSGLLLSVTDSLNRQTSYAYDSVGNVSAVTALAGTPNAVTKFQKSPTVVEQDRSRLAAICLANS